MSDLMEFPETVEEFMEEYKMVDTDQVYSNGTEYVPIFRMKQWFQAHEAIPIEWIEEHLKKHEGPDWLAIYHDMIVSMVREWKAEQRK